MKRLERKRKAAQLLGSMKVLVDSLPPSKRMELIAALIEVFSELDPAAATKAAAPRSA